MFSRKLGACTSAARGHVRRRTQQTETNPKREHLLPRVLLVIGFGGAEAADGPNEDARGSRVGDRGGVLILDLKKAHFSQERENEFWARTPTINREGEKSSFETNDAAAQKRQRPRCQCVHFRCIFSSLSPPFHQKCITSASGACSLRAV